MPVSSLYPRLDIPDVDLFSFLFRRKNRAFPANKIIHQDGDNDSRQLSYSAIQQAAVELGLGLQSHHKVKKGDVIALFTPNDIETPIVALAGVFAGAIVSPANPGYTVPELTYQLKDSGARLLFTHYSVIDSARQAAKAAGLSESDIILVGAPRDPSGKFQHWTSSREEAITRVEALPPAKVTPKKDVAFLVYSSGTTGRPKGVMITHSNIVSNLCQITACESGKMSWNGAVKTPGIPDAPRDGDKIIAVLPFFHIYGLNSLMLLPIYTGVTVVVLAKFEIEKFCRTIQEHKITFAFLVPPIALLLAKHPCVTNYDLSSLRMSNSGAAPLTKEIQEAVYKRCGLRVKQGYGLSETSPTTHEQRWEDWNIKIGTIGRLQPNMQAKFCAVGAEDGPTGQAPEELPTGQTGELYMKGPNVFLGYWKNKAATAECLSSDGWFRTGDVGHVDEDGDFFITDRVKELIKYKGFQVPPAELEGYLLDNEIVDDVVVVGVDSEDLGTEIPRAYIVRKGGLDAVQHGDDQKIIDWLAKKVANHKKLRGGIKFVDAVPKSASGKLLRRLIKDEAKKEYAEIERNKLKAKL